MAESLKFDPDAFMAAQRQTETAPPSSGNGFDPDAFMASQSVATMPAPSRAHHTGGLRGLTGRDSRDKETPIAGQIADLIEGTGKVAAPAAAVALPFVPLATIGAGVGGYLAGKGGSMAAGAMGASPDASRLIGDITAIPGAALGGMAGRPMLNTAKAISEPDVIDAIPGGKMARGIKDAFLGAYRRISAPATPPTIFSVSGDKRPIYGPVNPPPAVLRDNSSPAWAAFPSPSPNAPEPIPSPIDARLPSGRTVGPAPQANVIPLMRADVLPVWHGIRDSPALIPEPLTVPAPSALPSGRVVGGIANQSPIPPTPVSPAAAIGGNPGSAATTNASAEMMLRQRLANLAARGIPAPSRPDYAPITQQYKPSRTKARFDASGKRIGG